MNNQQPQTPPVPSPGPQGTQPGRTSTPPVGFGSGSSPLAQVRPQPISRVSTPSTPHGAGSTAGHSEGYSGAKSPFAGQPAPFRLSPSPAPSPAPMQGMQARPPARAHQSAAAQRVTSPLARSAVSPQPGGVPPAPRATSPAGAYGGVSRPMGSPPQQQYQRLQSPQLQQQQHPPPQQYPVYQQQQQQQQYQAQQYPPSPNIGLQQGYGQQANYAESAQMESPPPPLSQASAAALPASSRRRLYPEQQASAYKTPQPPLQQQQQQQQQQAYSQAPQESQGSGGQGGFFVPGASQAPAAPAGMTGGSGMGGYPAPPEQQQRYPQTPQYSQQQHLQQPQYPQQQYPQQQQVDGITQQFSQMGVGQSQQDYQTAPLGGKPPITALDEAPPPIRLPPGSMCVPSPFAQCPASHKRSTLNAIPRSDKLLRKTKLPFGLVVTPFKSQGPGEAPLPVASDIVRCRRCRTYINPFVQFVEGGRRWKCNLCGLNNDVPMSFDYDSATQTQKDRWGRVDLNHSVVEIVAPIEYMVRPPMPPVYVFVIDVSYAAVQIGAPGAVARTVRAALDDIPNADGRTKVAFIAVDTALHYFQLRAGSAEPQQLVVSDLEEVFLPSPTDLLVNLLECREGILNLLERFENMFQSNHAVGNALCPAVQAVLRLLGGLGGKVVVFQASAPTVGEGRVEPRAEGKDLGTPRESELLRAQNGWYKNMAAECSRPQIAFDMVFLGQQPMGMETVSSLARYTGGSVFHYPTFMAARRPEAERLAREVHQHLAAEIGLEAVLRIRASKGLRMAAYYGNFFLRSLDLLALPNVTPNHSYGVDLEIEETLTAPVVYFQTALLHTTAQGERRIRVSTLAVPTTENIHTVFHHADQVAIASLLAKKAVDRALEARLEDAREALQHKALEIIAAFKTECTQASSGATTQLQIPHALRLLPLLTLASLKHTSLRAGNTVSIGTRIAAMNLVLTLPPEMGVQPYTVGRMFALHDMPPQAGYADESGAVVLPPRLGLSAEALAPRGIYLLHTGIDTFLWFSRDADAAHCRSLLNEPDVGSIPNGVITFPDLGNAPEFELNQRVNAILRQLSSQSYNLWSPMTFICKEDGEPLIRLMLSQRLVEDMDPSAPSYQQFLGQLRDKINRGNF